MWCAVPAALSEWNVALADEGHQLVYTFDANDEDTGIPALLRAMDQAGIGFTDLDTSKSSLEEIFVDLVHRKDEGDAQGEAA